MSTPHSLHTPRSPRRAQQRDDPERGSSSAAVVVATLIPALLALSGLIYDGSTKAEAGRTASLAAAEAARAAGQHLAGDAIQGRLAAVDPSAGAAAARSYLATAGVTGTVAVSGSTITVTTAVPWKPTFNVYLPGSTLTGTATATSHRV